MWFKYGIISFDDSNFDMEFFLSQYEVIVDKNIRQQLKYTEYGCHIFSKYLVFQIKKSVFQSKYLVFRSKY